MTETAPAAPEQPNINLSNCTFSNIGTPVAEEFETVGDFV